MKEINIKEAINLSNSINKVIKEVLKENRNLMTDESSYLEAYNKNETYRAKVGEEVTKRINELKEINPTKFNMILFAKEEVTKEEMFEFIFNIIIKVAETTSFERSVRL